MSNKKKNPASKAEKHYGFQNFNIVRRIARELLVYGYRGYREFIDLPGTTDSTYNDRVEKVYFALETCMKWPDRGRKSVWTDEMRISENPLYSLFKTRSMTGSSQYALHFALLDILSDNKWHTLTNVHNQIQGDEKGIPINSSNLDFKVLINDHVGAGRIKVSKDGKYSLPLDIRERVSETNQENSLRPFIRVLSGRKRLTNSELINALNEDSHNHQYYGLLYIGQKNQISQRIDNFYHPLGIIRKDKKRGYAISDKSIDGLLREIPLFSEAISFFSEYSPLGIIGNLIMSEYDFKNDSFLFKNQYIFQALDSIVLYDVLVAIDQKTAIDIYTEQYSNHVPEVKTIYPICILSGVTDGRQYVYAYDPISNAYTSIRLDYIYGLIRNESFNDIEDTIISDGLLRLHHSWGSITGGVPYHVKAIIQCDSDETLHNISRERRIGTVTKINSKLIQFEASIYRPRDIVPWFMAYTGQLVSISVDKSNHGDSDSSRMLNRVKCHIEDLYRMYHGMNRVAFTETATYYPVPKGHLDYLDNMTEESPIFQTIYSKYLQCIKAILARTRDHHSVRQIQKIIDEEKRRFNISPLDREITFDRLFEDADGWGVIQRYNEHQRHIGFEEKPKYEEECCSFLIRRDKTPPLPLTEVQVKWLMAILEDEKIGLFLNKNEMERIKAFLLSTEYKANPIYKKSDIVHYDRFIDGDNITSQSFLLVFRTLLKAIRDNVKEVHIRYRSQQETISYYVKPLKLEYSKQADQFQLLGLYTQLPSPSFPLSKVHDAETICINLSGIERVEVNDSNSDDMRIQYIEPECEDPIVLRVINIYGALERFNITLSPYRKKTEFEGRKQYRCSDGKVYEVDSCLTTLYYSKRDEIEVLKKLRSFGRAIEVISPARIRQNFIDCVDRQYQVFVESGFMNSIVTP